MYRSKLKSVLPDRQTKYAASAQRRKVRNQGCSIDDNRKNSSVSSNVKTQGSLNKPTSVQLNDTKTIQRLLVPFKAPAAPNVNENAVINDAVTIDGLTTAAYTNTWNQLVAATNIANPVPLAINNFPGVSQGHFANFLNRMAGNDNSQKAMTTGYVIEDQVSHNPGLPGAANAQVGVGNAIPDFVINHNGTRGIVDITSSGQQGHVLNKNFNHAGFSYVSEATYPSINFNALGGVAPAMGANAAALAHAARQRQANRYFNRRLARFRRNIDLLSGGVLRNNQPFRRAGMMVKGRLMYLRTRQHITHQDVQVSDRRIRLLNRRIPPALALLRMPSIHSLIMNTRGRYLIAGNPHW